MATQFIDYFTHGSSYAEELQQEPIEKPRSKCCNSCAYTNCKDTVRPSDISLDTMLANGDYFDIFYCHDKDTDGNFKICATWYKLFGDVCLPRHIELEKQINDICNT
jgi:hypothetical protein